MKASRPPSGGRAASGRGLRTRNAATDMIDTPLTDSVHCSAVFAPRAVLGERDGLALRLVVETTQCFNSLFAFSSELLNTGACLPGDRHVQYMRALLVGEVVGR
jgi:hypothetical protein